MNGKMNEKVRKGIEKVLELLEKEEVGKFALAVFRGQGKPSDKWSFFNRLIMLSEGTEDARGYRQWQEVGRYVKKGAKAIYILVPLHKTIVIENKEAIEEIEQIKNSCNSCEICENCENCEMKQKIEELEKQKYIKIRKLTGFKAVPVFRYEDTEGRPLPENNFNVAIPCELDKVIKDLGLNIKTQAFNGREYGYFAPYRNEIVLSSPELEVLLHEIAHAVDHKLHDILKDSTEIREIVAELSSAIIGYLLGYRVSLKNVKTYISHYIDNWKKIYQFINRVERVVSYVIKVSSGIERVQAEEIEEVEAEISISAS